MNQIITYIKKKKCEIDGTKNSCDKIRKKSFKETSPSHKKNNLTFWHSIFSII